MTNNILNNTRAKKKTVEYRFMYKHYISDKLVIKKKLA